MDILKAIFSGFSASIQLYSVTDLLILLAFAAVALAICWYQYHQYQTSAYRKITANSYLQVRRDTGKLGEYLIYKKLRSMENDGAKFLFNIYVPKEDETTEIDVLMLHQKGIFVFESKNYSGWIFGKENQLKWTQVLPTGKGKSQKEHFYNPIMQNRTHIKYLKALLGQEYPYFSIVAFSRRCTLKDINVTSDVKVINRDDIGNTVQNILSNNLPAVLDEDKINQLYELLLPLTQKSEEEKLKHIEQIQNSIVKEAPAKTDEPATVSESVADAAPVEEVASPVQPEQAPENPSENTKICPRCGADLVLRTARRGANAGSSFYGCSNYPKCKYIEPITEAGDTHDRNC